MREIVELTPERQVVAAALGRARESARRRGLRPGDPARRRPTEVQLGGSHQGARDPQTVGDALSTFVGQFGWSPGITGGSIKGRWAELLGEDVAGHTQYVSFESGVLTMKADSTSWAANLRGFLLPTMLRVLGEKLGEGVVAQIEIQGPGGPGFGRGPRSVKGRGPRDTYG
ncbi:DUF721 domain-containing protein [Cellulomonas composti]|uniref:Uncharacterized protein n=1 Tax=Cellulomonas composti TaxID=266130 RepID=A0A511JDV8_9CELL|nr:DciA family protein [Cellulomonas composti]GEL96126.1 hypothetical protein CCO02nite_27840 [Cellulomonas composti]